MSNEVVNWIGTMAIIVLWAVLWSFVLYLAWNIKEK